MSSCSKCSRVIARKEGIACSKCLKLFHIKCAAQSWGPIPTNDSVKKHWECFACRGKTNHGQSPPSPAGQQPCASQESPQREIQLQEAAVECQATPLQLCTLPSKRETNMADSELRTALQTLIEKVTAIDTTIKHDVITGLTACNSAIEDAVSQLNTLNMRVDGLVERLEIVEQENINLKTRLEKCEEKLNNCEQQSLIATNTIEIHGIPIKANENPEQLVVDVAKALNVDISLSDINSAWRPRTVSDNSRPPVIITRLTSRRTKEAILRARRSRRDTFTTRQLGWSENAVTAIFVNERLTQANRAIYNEAKKLKQAKKVSFLWVREGRVLVRKAEGQPPILLRTLQETQNFS